MILNRKWLLTVGWKVLGLDMQNNNAIQRYVRYYPEKNAVLIADAHCEQVYGFKLSPEDYKRFEDGEIAITRDKSKNKTTGIVDELCIYYPEINCNHLINIHVIAKKDHVLKCVESFEKKIAT